MAENITTLLDRLPAGNLSRNDILYLVQGADANRDRQLSIGVLLDFITQNLSDVTFDSIDVAGTGSTLRLRNNNIKIERANDRNFFVDEDGVLTINAGEASSVKIYPDGRIVSISATRDGEVTVQAGSITAGGIIQGSTLRATSSVYSDNGVSGKNIYAREQLHVQSNMYLDNVLSKSADYELDRDGTQSSAQTTANQVTYVKNTAATPIKVYIAHDANTNLDYFVELPKLCTIGFVFNGLDQSMGSYSWSPLAPIEVKTEQG